MRIKILESVRIGKMNEELCEDELFLSEHYIAVIDGVTSKSDFLYEGKTTGKLAAEIIFRVLNNLHGKEDIEEIIEQVNQEFALFYEKTLFHESRREKGLQATCVIYSSYRRKIWMIGDCQAVVDGKIHLNPKKSDTVLSQMRSLVLHTLKMEASNEPTETNLEEHDVARDLILPWILRVTVYANQENTEYGYSVMNGERIPSSLIKTISLDEQEHEIILTSDGYPEVCKTLEESEACLQKLLEQDPGCYKKYLSTKGLKKGQNSFDDRTYIRFLVNKISRQNQEVLQ